MSSIKVSLTSQSCSGLPSSSYRVSTPLEYLRRPFNLECAQTPTRFCVHTADSLQSLRRPFPTISSRFPQDLSQRTRCAKATRRYCEKTPQIASSVVLKKSLLEIFIKQKTSLVLSRALKGKEFSELSPSYGSITPSAPKNKNLGL